MTVSPLSMFGGDGGSWTRLHQILSHAIKSGLIKINDLR